MFFIPFNFLSQDVFKWGANIKQQKFNQRSVDPVNIFKIKCTLVFFFSIRKSINTNRDQYEENSESFYFVKIP